MEGVKDNNDAIICKMTLGVNKVLISPYCLMSMGCIPEVKLRQITCSIKEWLKKHFCSKRQVQSFLGNLFLHPQVRKDCSLFSQQNAGAFKEQL